MATHFLCAKWAFSEDASYSVKILSHLLAAYFSIDEQNSSIIRAVLWLAGGLMPVYNVYQWHQWRRSRLWELILYLHEVLKEQRIEIEYTSNSHITSWQSQSLRNRSLNKVEVSSWDWERPGFCINHPGMLKKRFHQTNPPPQDGTPQCNVVPHRA